MTQSQADNDAKRKDRDTTKERQEPSDDVKVGPADEQCREQAPKTRRPKSGQAI